ncbi:restriction endonuclease fold toxin 3 of polymorphic toxin system [Chryseobacterium sp. 52]|uniref:restriction endonuclease fold toxin n=1 Tax=Chryseobacterium sp. 52 TaxID=2035213 RepID=UPI000C178F58|nr:restriction endonuclease fold toxin [Chryseobacterium sp. 52]PIF45762.1 restriction endonuclease fold toxin 3 of polymorphic toxin system [Chryseobacterium sp. 52]
MAPLSLWSFYVGGGSTNNEALMDFLAQNNGWGAFQSLAIPTGGGNGTFGETQAFRDIMASFYFGGIDFSQFEGDPPGNSLSRFREKTANWVQNNIREPLSGWFDNNTRNTFVLDAKGQAIIDDMRSQFSDHMQASVGGAIRSGAEYGIVGSGMGTGHVGAFGRYKKIESAYDVLSTNMKFDKGAHDLAREIGRKAQMRFRYSNREYDAISKTWIGQHKPGLTNSFGKSFRNQAKATFEDAKATNRGVYYKFDSQPAQSVIEKLNEYSLRYNVKLKINY